MLCDDCKEKPASVHLTKIINHQKTEKHLCEACAQKSGEISFSTDNKFFVQDLLKGLFSQEITNMPGHKPETACPSCGMTYADFSRHGKIGCGQCFSIFENNLEPLLRRIHGSSSHNGKAPKRSGGKLALRQKLKILRTNLEQYVSTEQYEEAAKVRDEIRALEKVLAEFGGER